jgi:hypothetical protein
MGILYLSLVGNWKTTQKETDMFCSHKNNHVKLNFQSYNIIFLYYSLVSLLYLQVLLENLFTK